jgi:hypothetical protein
MASDPFTAATAFSLEDDELLVAEALFALISKLDAPTESATAKECRVWMLLDTIATGRGLSIAELHRQAKSATSENGTNGPTKAQ